MTAVVSPIKPRQRPAIEPVWLSPAQVCERVPGLTEEILSDRRKRNLRPQFHKPSRKTVIYEQSEIDDWVASTASTPRITSHGGRS